MSIYELRQQQLIDYAKTELKTEAILLMVPKNIYYFSGFQADPHERFFALFIDVNKGKTILFLPSLDETAALGVAEVDEIVPVSDTEQPYEKFAYVVGSTVSSFALEKSYITMTIFEKLQGQFVHVSVKNVESFIDTLRAKKTEDEINIVKEAVTISEQALQKTWNSIRIGMTELEVKAELEYQMTMLGADAIAFETIVLSGKRSALPHGSANNSKIKAGDFLLFDFGVTKNGYHSDLTRTCIVGHATKEQEQIYQTVKRANELAIASVQAGEALQVIDQTARNYITEQGYGDFFKHRIGHGLGLDVHEYPSIHESNTEKITPGLLFTIEPGIYVPDIGGVRIEDDIYVQEDGTIEVLSSFTKDLIQIGNE